MGLVPSDTKVVFSIGVQDARDSEFGQFILRNLQVNDPHMQQFMTQTGFDPRRDLQAMVVALGSTGGGASNNSSFAVLARGSFDMSKITALAQQHGSKVQRVADVDVYLPGDGKGPSQHAFAFLDPDVVGIGDLNSLRQMIANRETPSQLDPNLQSLVEKASAGQEIWFASTGGVPHPTDMPQGGEGHQQQVMQALQGIVRSCGGIKLGNVVQFSFDAITRSDKDAMSLGDVIRFLAAAAQMQRDQNAQQAQILGPALDNLNLSTSGNEVHVTTAVPENLLERMGPVMGAISGQPHAR
jgi:hypothetical protein